jgi:acyl transferase domain-containing protein
MLCETRRFLSFCAAEAVVGGGRLPLELSVIGFGAKDRAGVLRLAKELLAKNQTPREAAEEAVRQGLREHLVRVALYAEDQGALQKSLSLLVQILEKGGSPARLEAQGVYLREEAPLSSDSVAFMFPGQGSQYVGMMDELRAKYPIVEQTLQEADATMEKFLPKRLSSYMTKDTSQDEMESFFALSQTEVLQPAILASDEAIRRLISPLITPRMVFGHSLGEYGACVAAGVMSFSNALRIVAAREGALANVEIKDNGKMLAVGTNEETINRLLKGIKGYVVVVNKNCPSQTIIGGETAAVEEAEAKLKAAGLEGVYLPVSHAFHSDIVGPGSVPLLEELRKIEIHTPRLSILSNVAAVSG